METEVAEAMLGGEGELFEIWTATYEGTNRRAHLVANGIDEALKMAKKAKTGTIISLVLTSEAKRY